MKHYDSERTKKYFSFCRRHSGRGPRRPAPPLPDPPALAPLRASSGSNSSSPLSLSVQPEVPSPPSPPITRSAVETEEPEGADGLWARIVHQWRKQLQKHFGPEVNTEASAQQSQQSESPNCTVRSSGAHIVDTEPLLIESQP